MVVLEIVSGFLRILMYSIYISTEVVGVVIGVHAVT